MRTTKRSKVRLNTKHIDRYVQIGKHDKNWYHECQVVFEELFGADELELVAKLFAATSMNTSLKSNITLFRKAYYEIKNDMPIGNYLPGIKAQIGYIRAGESLRGLKINSFQRAMSGDPNAVVVDLWISRAFGIHRTYFRQTKGKPQGIGRDRTGGISNGEYRKVEKWIRNRAKKVGLEPRQLCAMIWSGVRISMGGGRETHYKSILRFHLNNLFNVI